MSEEWKRRCQREECGKVIYYGIYCSNYCANKDFEEWKEEQEENDERGW